MKPPASCPSRYTIDRRTGEALACDKPAAHAAQRDPHAAHTASYGSRVWYWHTREEDPRG